MKFISFALAFFWTSSAMAEVCDKARPNWSPVDGPTSGLSETITILTSPFGIFMVIATIAALAVRRTWGYLTISAIAFLPLVPFVLAYTNDKSGSTDAIFHAAITEGCIGSPVVYLICAALFAIGMIWAARLHSNSSG